MDVRAETERLETQMLAAWASLSSRSRGRERPEQADALRTCYQRDRDRILHTKAFRRLMHKTQVFVSPEGDHYRTRLTHTLEVAQVARTICRALRLNEDLVEAICLAHDVGHTPFGHVGEEALAKAMGRPFEHNRQSLRIVEHLERLNLTWEVRDGILNHTWRMPEPSTAEAMVARWSDRIAYVNHDLDDAIRAGILRPSDVPADVRSVLGETYGERVDTMVGGIVHPSRDADAIVMRPDVAEAMSVLRTFLFDRVYLGPARDEEEKAARVLQALYDHYLTHPVELPLSYQDGGQLGSASPAPHTPRAPGDASDHVADYVSGMTDRFAVQTYRRLFVPKGDV